LADVLAESKQVFERLLLLVSLLPEDDLLAPHRFDRYVVPFWKESQALWKCIAGDSYEHYREHRQSIQAWLDRSSGKFASAAEPAGWGDNKRFLGYDSRTESRFDAGQRAL
jgi:hypothetical protein